jgi:hypothetical protein
MKMTKLKTPALALMAALACTGESAWAQLQSDYIISYNGTTTASYQQFNPSLGTLTGVDIVFNIYDTAQALVYSPNGGLVGYSDAAVNNGSESVSAFGFTLASSTLQAEPVSGTASQGINPAGPGSVQNLTKTFQEADFSSFIGTGSLNETVTVTPGTGLYSGTGSVNDLFFGGTFNSSGTIEIEYFYDPSVIGAVPEAQHFPAATAGVAGLVGLVALIRQVRRPAA